MDFELSQIFRRCQLLPSLRTSLGLWQPLHSYSTCLPTSLPTDESQKSEAGHTGSWQPWRIRSEALPGSAIALLNSNRQSSPCSPLLLPRIERGTPCLNQRPESMSRPQRDGSATMEAQNTARLRKATHTPPRTTRGATFPSDLDDRLQDHVVQVLGAKATEKEETTIARGHSHSHGRDQDHARHGRAQGPGRVPGRAPILAQDRAPARAPRPPAEHPTAQHPPPATARRPAKSANLSVPTSAPTSNCAATRRPFPRSACPPTAAGSPRRPRMALP